jgi:hypothetical protein
MPWTIYCHTLIADGRRYIGLTSRSIGRRWSQHVTQSRSSKGGRWHFPNAIRRYGPQAFSHHVLGVCDSLDEANLVEEAWIFLLDTRNPEKGFNLAKGGSHTPHPIQNPWDNPAYRSKQALVDKSHLHSPRSNEKRSSAYSTPESKAKRSEINRAIHGTPEARSRNSESHRGKALSPEHRAKISNNVSIQNFLKPPELRAAHSRKMRESLRISMESWTDEDVRKDRDRRSKTSRSLNTIASTQTDGARQRHREVCAKLSPMDISLIRLLRTDGFTQSEIANVLGVTRKAISYHEHR